MYTPDGTGIFTLGSSELGISMNPAAFDSFSSTVAYTQVFVGPLVSAFTISLSPCSIFLAFSPSSKKYAAFDNGSVKEYAAINGIVILLIRFNDKLISCRPIRSNLRCWYSYLYGVLGIRC